MRITFSDDPRDFLRRDWTGLCAADPEATLFHTPRYLKLYWEEFGQDIDLLLAFAEQDRRTVGAVAFERTGPLLRFLGGTEVTDYMGPVAEGGFEEAVAKELLAALTQDSHWERADLGGLPGDSAWLARLARAAREAGMSVDVAEDGVAPLLYLPSSFQEYLRSLPGKLRHEARRKQRRLQEAGPYRLVHATEQSLHSDLDRFVAMHRSSEGPKGKFLEPGMEIFFRRLGEAFLPDGVFRLAFAEMDGTKVAGAIGFSFAGTFYLYNSAFDRRWARLSPGMVLVSELVRTAIEEGCARFDLLKGDLQYKYRFGAEPRDVKRLVLTPGYASGSV